jgi:hypothetical protein
MVSGVMKSAVLMITISYGMMTIVPVYGIQTSHNLIKRQFSKELFYLGVSTTVILRRK